MTGLAVGKAYKNVDIRPIIIDIVKHTESTDWKEELRKSCFGELLLASGNENKSLLTLVEEYKTDNEGNNAVLNKSDELQSFVENVEQAMDSESCLGEYCPITTV